MASVHVLLVLMVLVGPQLNIGQLYGIYMCICPVLLRLPTEALMIVIDFDFNAITNKKAASLTEY